MEEEEAREDVREKRRGTSASLAAGSTVGRGAKPEEDRWRKGHSE